ncbi:RPA family protein [Halorubrum pallidum]
MSADGPGTREVARRVFAAEFDDASLSYSESDEERAPNYVVTPTGARVNRLFVAGVLTEVERVNDETRRGRVVDPTGAFVTYAGQYQPEAQTFLERADPPAFVALTGKARTFEPEDSDRVFTSVRPESLSEVDADTRDRWVVSAAEATLDRLAVFEMALDSDLRGEELRAGLEAGGAPAALADGIPRAIAHYDTTTAYVEAVRRLAVDALEMIAGDRDEVRPLDVDPDEGDATAIGPLPDTDVTVEASSEPTGDDPTPDEDVSPESEPSDDEGDAEPIADTGVSTGPVTDEPSASDSGSAGGSDPHSGGGDPDAVIDAADADSDAAETADSVDPDDAGLGDFDAGDGSDPDSDGDGSDPDSDGDATADPDADDMYQLDDEEREEIESEFGTDFATGTEVDDPGEADIDVPDPEELAEEPVDDPSSTTDDETGTDSVEADSAESATAGGPEADADGDEVDLEAAAVAAMGDLDDGDGAPREAVVERVADEHGVEPGAVEDAIQDALMGGKCYEPGDGVLKPI